MKASDKFAPLSTADRTKIDALEDRLMLLPMAARYYFNLFFAFRSVKQELPEVVA